MIPSLVPAPRSAERDRAQLDAVQPVARAGPGGRRRWSSRSSASAGASPLNGLSFFLVVFALAALHLPAHVPSTNPRAIGDELRSGLHYVRDNRLLLTAHGARVRDDVSRDADLDAAAGVCQRRARRRAARRETRLWMLMACQGLGAILGALIVGSLGRFRHMGRALLGRCRSCSALLIAAFAASRSLPLSLVLLFLAGHLLDGGVLDELLAACSSRCPTSCAAASSASTWSRCAAAGRSAPRRRRARRRLHGADRDDRQRPRALASLAGADAAPAARDTESGVDTWH